MTEKLTGVSDNASAITIAVDKTVPKDTVFMVSAETTVDHSGRVYVDYKSHTIRLKQSTKPITPVQLYKAIEGSFEDMAEDFAKQKEDPKPSAMDEKGKRRRRDGADWDFS